MSQSSGTGTIADVIAARLVQAQIIELRAAQPTRAPQTHAQDNKELHRTMGLQSNEDSCSSGLEASIWDATLLLGLPHLHTCSIVAAIILVLNTAVQSIFAVMVSVYTHERKHARTHARTLARSHARSHARTLTCLHAHSARTQRVQCT